MHLSSLSPRFSRLSQAFLSSKLTSSPLRASFRTLPPSRTMSAANLTLRPHRSEDRGSANHGWLNSYHTFSFADYYDPEFERFGCLRVINEDRVTGGNGFGRHPHRDAEIFSYIVSGALKHDDSLGNSEILKRGDVQFTTTGRGISHSEYNASKTELVHFLQIWVTPAQRSLPPVYQTKTFEDVEKRGKLRLFVSPDGAEGSCVINNNIKAYASLLGEGETVRLNIGAGRKAYVHVVMDVVSFDGEKRETSVEVNGGEVLRDGDGCFVTLIDNSKEGVLELTGHTKGTKPAEVIVFDIGA